MEIVPENEDFEYILLSTTISSPKSISISPRFSCPWNLTDFMTMSSEYFSIFNESLLFLLILNTLKLTGLSYHNQAICHDLEILTLGILQEGVHDYGLQISMFAHFGKRILAYLVHFF